MNKSIPVISVIMPVFNSEKYLGKAIESILNQTFDNFEFIIINDGSTDGSKKIINKYNDNRMFFIDLEKNSGNYAARNLGLKAAIGKYICVMDSDDISLPHRLETQYNYMESNPEVAICGSQVNVPEDEARILNHPKEYEQLKVFSLQNNFFFHPTLMIRNSFRKKHKLFYNEKYYYAADYDFLARAMKFAPVYNLSAILLSYRLHNNQITHQYYTKQQEYADEIRLKQLANFGICASPSEKKLHLSLVNLSSTESKSQFHKLVDWANRLCYENEKNIYYQPEILILFLRNTLKTIRKRSAWTSYSDKEEFSDKIESLNKILNPLMNLPFHKEWAVLPDFIYHLIEFVKENKPSTIVECGSGLSTLVGGYMVKSKIINQFISIEHEEQFYEATLDDLKRHSLEKHVTLLYAPLKRISINGKEWFWYDTDRFENTINQIDLLLVDGPPGQIQKNSRYPALHMLKKFLNNKTIIVMDDSKREDERAIINQWLIENPDYEVDYHDTLKGMAIITKSKA
jgi:glycosyltransferase involved in cell wall biosynthesis